MRYIYELWGFSGKSYSPETTPEKLLKHALDHISERNQKHNYELKPF